MTVSTFIAALVIATVALPTLYWWCNWVYGPRNDTPPRLSRPREHDEIPPAKEWRPGLMAAGGGVWPPDPGTRRGTP